jgi:hypothetical protein
MKAFHVRGQYGTLCLGVETGRTDRICDQDARSFLHEAMKSLKA